MQLIGFSFVVNVANHMAAPRAPRGKGQLGVVVQIYVFIIIETQTGGENPRSNPRFHPLRGVTAVELTLAQWPVRQPCCAR